MFPALYCYYIAYICIIQYVLLFFQAFIVTMDEGVKQYCDQRKRFKSFSNGKMEGLEL
jgi:hypothetical protein